METAFRSEERFTQEQFRAWLDGLPSSSLGKYELIQGTIVVTPPARWPHASAESAINAAIHDYATRTGSGISLAGSAGFEFPSGETLAPDASFISLERWATLPTPLPERFLPVAPNLAVEILSPSTANRDRAEKKSIYATHGVEEYWLIDTRTRETTIFYRHEGAFGAPTTLSEGEIVSHALPGLRVRLDAIFATP